YTRAAFARTWENHAGTARSVSWHLAEIVAHAARGLEAPRWSLQHAAGFTLAAAIKALADSCEERGQIAEGSLKTVWPVFEKALALKTFEGKEKVLAALPVL